MARQLDETVMGRVIFKIGPGAPIPLDKNMRGYFTGRTELPYGKYTVDYPMKNKGKQRDLIRFVESLPRDRTSYTCTVTDTKKA